MHCVIGHRPHSVRPSPLRQCPCALGRAHSSCQQTHKNGRWPRVRAATACEPLKAHGLQSKLDAMILARISAQRIEEASQENLSYVGNFAGASMSGAAGKGEKDNSGSTPLQNPMRMNCCSEASEKLHGNDTPPGRAPAEAIAPCCHEGFTWLHVLGTRGLNTTVKRRE